MQSNSVTPSPPRKGKYHGPFRAADYIPRPPNSFILYRSDFVKKGLIPSNVESKQQTLSVLASKCWKRLGPEEQGVWIELAEKMKREHSLRYPAFTYKPSPKRHIKPRRQSRTREQQIAAVEELMEQYLPDEGGSVPHNRVSITTEARKTRTYTKSRQAPPQPPHDSVAKNDAEAHNCLLPSKDEPVFMEPLRPPSPIIYRPMSWAWPEANQVGQPSISTTGHKESAMVHRSFTSFNFPQQEWQVDSMSNLQVQSPPDVIDVSESFPDVVEHIRGQYDSAPRSEIPPTASSLEAHSAFDPQLFIPYHPTHGIHNTILQSSSTGMRDHMSRNAVFSTGPFFENAYNQPPPSFVSEVSAPAPVSFSCPQSVSAFSFPASFARQNFPMTVEVHEKLNFVHLQTPVFGPQSGLPLGLNFMIQTPLVSHTDTPKTSGNFALDINPVFLGDTLDSLGLGESDTVSGLCQWVASIEEPRQVDDTNGDE